MSTTTSDNLCFVREHIPLEQGLRLHAKSYADTWKSQRAYSIRTRIKTTGCLSIAKKKPIVREHIPLEQGLRLMKICIHWNSSFWSESIFH